jgi:hypothetical protein
MSVTVNSNNGSVIYAPDELFAGAVLGADQTVTNSATLVNVPALKIPVGKYERVLFRFNIFYTTTADGDMKYRLDVPASPTLYRLVTEEQAPAATAMVSGLLTSEADDTVLAASGTEGFIRLVGVLSNGATAGDLQFQFAQNTATSAQSAIIRAGSFAEYRVF